MSRKISVATTKTSTAEETLFTVPVKNTGLWQLAYVINTNGTNTPSVFWYDASEDVEYYVLGGKNLGSGEYVLLNQAEVALQEGDEIRVALSTTGSVTFIFTIELVPNQAVQYHRS